MNMLDKAKAYGNTALTAGKMMVGAVQQQNQRRRLDQFNAEIAAQRKREADAEAARLRAVSESVRGGRDQRLAPAAMTTTAPAAPAGTTLARRGVPVAQQVSAEDRAKYLQEQEDAALQRR